MTEAEKRIRAAVGVLDPAVLEAARKELDSAFIDCTLHAQVAIHVGRYLRSCSPENIAALLAEIDRLTRERDEARAERDHARQQSREWLKENGPGGWIDNLRAERDAMAKDAERYRWLRGSSCPDHSRRWTLWEIRHWRAPFWTGDLRHGDLDTAIDAQIEQEERP